MSEKPDSPELTTRLRAAAAAIRRDAVNAFYLEVADLMEAAARSLEEPRQSIYVTRSERTVGAVP